ncbi:MAG: GTPase HflX, partial [Cardiobacteriaceae bacterium]|nr:GTPase HflX [Cardiobacteriaceae bacterium]
GGIGLRGPGETQLETDRRLLGARISQLKRRLAKVHRQREENRKARARRDMPMAALAGYTNSGKSTIFNAITDANVLAKDQLFATLDPTWRRLVHDGVQTILLADTVGFVSDLPHELVEAFKSTLEETAQANLVLHVIDFSDDDHIDREGVVDAVLADIGADDIPQIRVYNKIDLRGEDARVKRGAEGQVEAVYCSALTGAGMDLLVNAIVEFFAEAEKSGWLNLLPQEGAIRAELYALRAVLGEETLADGSLSLQIRLPEKHFHRLQSKYNRAFDLQETPEETV